MATFSDSTSSNGMSNNWVTEITYNTTAYAGYTLVEATLSLTIKYGWDFTLSKGYSLTIDGNSVTGSGKVIKQTDKNGNGVKYTLLTHSVKIYHTSNKKITISGSVNGSNVLYVSGGYYVGTYSLSKDITLVPSTTRCTAPTSVNVSPSSFESNVTITWSGAGSGTNNAISGYSIKVYLANEANTGWVYDTYYNCKGVSNSTTSVSASGSSGSATYDFSWIPRGRHTKVNIVTIGTQSGYNSSSGKDSNTVVRIPHTVCVAPTSFTITQDVSNADGFDASVTLEWSGASGGTNNAINAYLIEYSICDDNSSFYTWNTLQTISTTKTSYSLSKDVSSQVARGKFVMFRIRTQGVAGTSYYSGYKVSNSLRRNPYTKCIAPTNVAIKSEADINGNQHNDVFNNQITISWASGGAGENNDIKRYYIEYCVSNNKANWSGWDTLQSSDLTPKGTTSTTVNVSTKVDRGIYVKFRIRTEGTVMTKGADGNYLYYSNYVESPSIRRNSISEISALRVVNPTSLEYSYGDAIYLHWDVATDKDNNINNYELSVQYTENNVWSDWKIISSTSHTGVTDYVFIWGDKYYGFVSNNEKLQFRIRVRDVFGEWSSLYSTSEIITRYDITGVSIGLKEIDAKGNEALKWRSCQIYVGKLYTTIAEVNADYEDIFNPNNISASNMVGTVQWVEQSVSAGVNNAWVDAGL